MNICFYTHSKPIPEIGGVERVTYNLCNYFKRIGLGVFNLYTNSDDPESTIPANADDGEKVRFINDYLRRKSIDILIDQYGANHLFEHPHIPQNVKIIYCYHLNPESRHLTRSLLETFSFRTLKYSIFNLACLLNTPNRRYKFRKMMNRKLNGGIDKVVYLSENFLPLVRAAYMGHDHLFAAIPNAVEEKLLITPLNELVAKRKRIVWCGRIAHNPKNVLFLPRLWSRLEQRHPDWEMIIVGGGIDRDLLERRIASRGLERISVTGYVDPYHYYESASIFVHPSFSEGFGMVLIEAMSFGCVPVAFNSSRAYRDIISSGKDGIIVPDMDEDAFVEACDRLMNDETLRQNMALNAQKKVKKFSIDKVSKQWIGLFEELTECRN